MAKNKKVIIGVIIIALISALALIIWQGYRKPIITIEPPEGVSPSDWTPFREEWLAMVEKMSAWQNGKEKIIELGDLENPNPEYLEIGRILLPALHKLNLQAGCVFGEEDIQEIKQNDRVIELIFKIPTDITISQWVEPEERYHIPVDEKGYRILKSVKTALFILEDRQDRGLEAHILIAHTHVGDLPVVGYSCWAIKQEDSQELDKSWIKEINKMLKR